MEVVDGGDGRLASLPLAAAAAAAAAAAVAAAAVAVANDEVDDGIAFADGLAMEEYTADDDDDGPVTAAAAAAAALAAVVSPWPCSPIDPPACADETESGWCATGWWWYCCCCC